MVLKTQAKTEKAVAFAPISAKVTQHTRVTARAGRDEEADGIFYWPKWNAARMTLPFIHMEGLMVESYWRVGQSGEYSVDHDIGRRYAAQWLEQCATNPHTPHLSAIVMDMAKAGGPFGIDGVAVGFIEAVEAAAMEGWEPVVRAIKSCDIPPPPHGKAMSRLKRALKQG
jgi:hypothetical protein